MPTDVPFEFCAFRIEFVSGGSVLVPVLVPGVAWPDGSTAEMAGTFCAQFSKTHLAQGRCIEALRHVPPPSLEPRGFELRVPESRKGLHPALSLRFDVFVAPLPAGGRLGFVPALGVEAYVPPDGDLEEALRDTVLLEFARHKRLATPRGLVPALWYGPAAVERRPVKLRFHSLHELEELAAGSRRRWLPEAASPMIGLSPRVFGLESPCAQMIRALGGRFARSVLLVGRSGSGKSALVEKFCRDKSSDLDLSRKTVWATTAAQLLRKLVGDAGWQENLSTVCRDLREDRGILYVRNLADLFHVGQYIGNEVSMAEYLRPALDRGEITLISECTDEEAAWIELRAPGYLGLFHSIRLEEPDSAALEAVLGQRFDRDAVAKRPRVSLEAIREALRLLRRFAPYSGYPGKAVRFLDGLLDNRTAKGAPPEVGPEEVIRRFCEESGMPPALVDPDAPLPLDELGEKFRTRVFGQEEAAALLVALLASVKAGVTRPGRPVASLFFTGPTGVGKTEMAKALAEAVFGDPRRVVRFDMSEFADPASVLRLSGDGGGGEGLLTGAVRREPFSVLLFDEVEKADPSFFDRLLQVLGEGRLTDARGRTADFCSAIVVMTSNLGAGQLPSGSPGYGGTSDRRREVAEHFRAAAESFFRPEFYNRIDRVVPFLPLDRPTIRRIVDREMRKFRSRAGLRFRDVRLDVAPETLDLLGELGYDEAFGARQLQRAFREALAVPLARRFNEYFAAAPLRARVGVKEGRIHVTVRGEEAPGETGGRTADDEARLSALLERVEDHRRMLRSVQAGPVFARLESEFFRLEQRLRRLEEDFWKNPIWSADYAAFGSCLETCRSLFEEVLALETQAMKALADRTGGIPADLEPRIARCREKTDAALFELIRVLHKEDDACVVAVYGPGSSAFESYALYDALAHALGFRRETRKVFWNEGKKRPETAPCPSRGKDPPGSPVGYEIEISGPLAHRYFDGEDGRHVRRDPRGNEESCAVIVARGKWADYDPCRPEEIHRKAFATNFPVRRVYGSDGFEERPVHKEFKTRDVKATLLDLFEERMRENMYRELAGEEDEAPQET